MTVTILFFSLRSQKTCLLVCLTIVFLVLRYVEMSSWVNICMLGAFFEYVEAYHVLFYFIILFAFMLRETSGI